MCALLYYLCLKIFPPPSVGNNPVLHSVRSSQHSMFPKHLSARQSASCKAPAYGLPQLRGRCRPPEVFRWEAVLRHCLLRLSENILKQPQL